MNSNTGKRIQGERYSRVSPNAAMREYDRLPKAIRRCLQDSVMPWGPVKIRRMYLDRMRETDPAEAKAYMIQLIEMNDRRIIERQQEEIASALPSR